jgi:hypothetical protein
MRASTSFWALGALVSGVAASAEGELLRPRNATGAPSDPVYDPANAGCYPISVTVTKTPTCPGYQVPPQTIYSTIWKEKTIFTTDFRLTTELEYTTEWCTTTTTSTYETSYPVTVTTVIDCETGPPSYPTTYAVYGAVTTPAPAPTDCGTVTTTEWRTTTTTECITITKPTTTTRTYIVPTTIEETQTIVQPTTVENTRTVVTPTTIENTRTVVTPTTIVETDTVTKPTTIWVPTTYTTTTTFVTERTATITSDHTVVSVSVTTATETSVSTFTTSYPVVSYTTVPVTQTQIITGPGATVTAPGQTITAPGETVTATPRFEVTLCPSVTGVTAPLETGSDRTFGCKPGYVCNPTKPEGCNFWPGPPSKDYLCNPDDCIVSPPFINVTWPDDKTKYFPPSFGYFNLNPNAFGLSYDIFEYVVVEEVRHGHTKTITTGNWETQSTLPIWPDAPATTSSSAAVQRRVVHKFNKRADAPAECFDDCNNAYLIAESVGKSDALCKDGSDFKNGYDECTKCITDNSDATKDTVRDYVKPEFDQYLDFCSSKNTSPTQSSMSAPASDVTSIASVSTTSQAKTSSTDFTPLPTTTTTTETSTIEVSSTSTESTEITTSTVESTSTTQTEVTSTTTSASSIVSSTTVSSSAVTSTSISSEVTSTVIVSETATTTGTFSTPATVPSTTSPATVPGAAPRLAIGTTIMVSVLTMLAAFFG